VSARKIGDGVTLPNERQFEDLVRRADAYILALRQALYAGSPDIRKRAMDRLNELGSCWYAARLRYPGAHAMTFLRSLWLWLRSRLVSEKVN